MSKQFEGVGSTFPDRLPERQQALKAYMGRAEENEQALLDKIKKGYVEPGTEKPAPTE